MFDVYEWQVYVSNVYVIIGDDIFSTEIKMRQTLNDNRYLL